VGSLKSPLRAGTAGAEIAWLQGSPRCNPMFGARHRAALRPAHVVFVDLGERGRAPPGARELFASTMAEQVVMSLDEHDRLIAYVLGLSHAPQTSRFFTAARRTAGEAAPRLAAPCQARLSMRSSRSRATSAQESPELYYEIQSLNDLRRRVAGGPVQGGRTPADRRVCRKTTAQFVALMRRGARLSLADRRQAWRSGRT